MFASAISDDGGGGGHCCPLITQSGRPAGQRSSPSCHSLLPYAVCCLLAVCLSLGADHLTGQRSSLRCRDLLSIPTPGWPFGLDGFPEAGIILHCFIFIVGLFFGIGWG